MLVEEDAKLFDGQRPLLPVVVAGRDGVLIVGLVGPCRGQCAAKDEGGRKQSASRRHVSLPDSCSCSYSFSCSTNVANSDDEHEHDDEQEE